MGGSQREQHLRPSNLLQNFLCHRASSDAADGFASAAAAATLRRQEGKARQTLVALAVVCLASTNQQQAKLQWESAAQERGV